MTKILRYIIAASLATTACLMWLLSSHAYFLRILGNILICIPVFILDPNQMKKPIHFVFPSCQTKGFYTTIMILLGILLVVILIGEMPDRGNSLFGKWYFIGTVWLIYLAGLARRYVEEKENAQQQNPGGRE